MIAGDAWRRKRAIADLLVRIGVLRIALRAYVAAVATVARARDWAWRAPAPPDGLPLPPAALRLGVGAVARRGARAGSAAHFLEKGTEAAALLDRLLAGAGTSLEACEAILDFGCGCGRITRHLYLLDGERLYGSDIDRRAIEWCRENLPFAHFSVNDVAPPLPHASDLFDLVYAFSVFTHLPSDLQRRWVDEVQRVLRPRGLFVVSTHGDLFLGRLTGEERRRFDAGQPVELYTDQPGSALCSIYNPTRHVRDVLGDTLELVELAPGAFDDQDVYLFRRPSTTARLRQPPAVAAQALGGRAGRSRRGTRPSDSS